MLLYNGASQRFVRTSALCSVIAGPSELIGGRADFTNAGYVVDIVAPRHDDARTFPYSSQHHIPDGFVVFDDVFVPHERVFLDGEAPHAAVFAHNLGMWQRLGSLAFMAADADRMVGFAQLIAEANGLARVAHVTEKITPEYRQEIENCFKSMSGVVHGFLRRLTRGDKELSEDLVQETFKEAAQSWHKLRVPQSGG